MTGKEALALVEQIIYPEVLSKIQGIIFQQSWQGYSYQEIAKQHGYDDGYIRDVGAKLWRLVAKNLGCKVTKNNFKLVLKRYQQTQMLMPVVSDAIRSSVPSNALKAYWIQKTAYYEDYSKAIAKTNAVNAT
ncbi:MAG TPA: hypothetical protein V6C78_34835 [Crinalium sp.]|jgi:hypothetical protein